MKHFIRLMEYSKGYIFLNVLGLVFSLAVIITGLYIPYLTKEVVDDVLVAGNFGQLRKLILYLLIVTAIRTFVQYGKLYIFEYTSQRLLYDLRSDLYAKLQAQSFEFYDRIRTGLLMNRMVGDLQSIRQLTNQGYVQIFEGIFSLVTTVAVMLTLNVQLTLGMLVIVPFIYLSTSTMAKSLRPVFQQIRRNFEDLTSAVQENITGIRVVKAFGREEFEKEKFAHIAQVFTSSNIDSADIRATYLPFARLINGLGVVVILLLGGYLVIRGDLTIGSLVAFNGYMLMLQIPINNANALVNQWENAQASLEKIFELFDEKTAICNKESATILSKCQGDIVFNHVYFRYGEDDVLMDINLRMKPGTTTAIMGDTGAGKSTIINLIARFYDCTEGQVTVDGIDVRDLEYNSLRHHIGVILQETFLFSDTIAANIAFAKPNATREEIEQAAKIADAHSFIVNMADGYESVVGERGLGLSGGQRQRIAIARAILCNPKILILDDATSSVDMETEHEIQQTLNQILENRTTLIIAHRISSVKNADQIIMLENGKICEQGTHDELVNLKGKYYQTLLEQYSEYEENGSLGNEDLCIVSGGVENHEKHV